MEKSHRVPAGNRLLKRAAAVILSLALMLLLFNSMELEVAAVGTNGCPYNDEHCTETSLAGTHDHIVCISSGQVITDGSFKGVQVCGGTITGGTFEGEVSVESGTITGGIFNQRVAVTGGIVITGGTFNQQVVLHSYFGAEIKGGTFLGDVEVNNAGKITAGTFEAAVTNKGTISGGNFYGQVTNEADGTITGGRYASQIINKGAAAAVAGVTYDLGLSSVSGTADISSGTPHVPHTPAYVHTHSYSWVTVQEVTAEQDGIEEYRCSCGDVKERNIIPASEVLVKGLYGEIKDAPSNGTAAFDTGRQYTLSDYIIRKLSERTDVTVTITFQYEGQSYRMTIPAGADYTKLLADEDYFYGYFYFANAVGAVIEAV